MKKHITLLSCLCLASGFYAQNLNKTQKIAKEFSTQKPVSKIDNTPKALGDVIWSNDFSNPADWTINNSGQTGPDFGWNVNATESTWWTSQLIMSSSGGNFAEVNNGNPTVNPGTQATGVVYTITTANPIDISTAGTTDLLLQFEQFGALFNDLQEYQISGNGTTWVTVGNNTDKGTLSAAGGAAYDNTDKVAVSIEEALLGMTQPVNQIWVRFRWTTRFPDEGTNPGVWIAYTWMIDDVAITERADYDLLLTEDFWGSVGLNYYMIPLAQVAPIEFTTAVENFGSLGLTNVQLNASITGAGTFTGSSAGAAIPSGDSTTLEVSTTYTPAVAGTYNVTRTLTMTETDDVVYNDNLDNITFTVGGNIYARDNNVPDGYSNNQDDPYEVGNMFDIYTDATLKAINVRLDGETVTAANGRATIYGRVYEVGDEFELIAETEEIMDISSGTMLNNNNFKLLLDNVELTAGKTYLAMVGTFDPNLYVANGGYSYDQTSFFLDGNDIQDNTLFYQNETPMVRLNFDPTLGVNELELASDVTAFPNPFSNETAVSFTLKADAEVSVVVTDLAGRVVTTVPAAQLAAGDHSIAIDGTAFTAGVYNYVLTVGGNSTTKRIVKK